MSYFQYDDCRTKDGRAILFTAFQGITATSMLAMSLRGVGQNNNAATDWNILF